MSGEQMPDPYEDLARSVIGATLKPRRRNYDDIIERHASRQGVDPDLVRAVMGQESGGNPRAVSPKGASGLMQLMPGTARRFGVKNISDPEENIRGGTEYLKFLTDRYKGNIDKVLAGYNAGEGNVDKFGGVPPFKETQTYVPSVKKRYQQLSGRAFQSQGDDDPYRRLAEEVLTPTQPDDEYTKLARSVIESPASASQPKPSRFEGIRAGVKGQKSVATGDPFALLKSINAQPTTRSPDDALREQAVQNVTSFTVDPVANVRSLIGAARRGTQAQVDVEAEEEFQRLKAAEARAKTPEMTAIRKEYGRMPTVPTLMGVPVQTRSVAQPLARTAGGLLKIVGGLTSLGGLTENDFSKWANTRGRVVEEAASLPPLNEAGEEIKRQLPEKIQTALNDTGLGIAQIIFLKKATGLPLGQLMALETAARTSDEPLDKRAGRVAESYAMGRVLQRHLSRPASAVLFGAPTAAREGQQVLQGASLEDAILNTAVQAGVGFGLGGKQRARQTETQRQGVQAEQPAETTTKPFEVAQAKNTRDAGLDADRAPANEVRQRFQHLQFGEIEVLPDQSGARPGKIRVAEVADPTKQHFVKKSDLQGRGNARMIPIKESAGEVLPEVPAEQPQQPSEMKGALPATPLSPETVRVEPEKAEPPKGAILDDPRLGLGRMADTPRKVFEAIQRDNPSLLQSFVSQDFSQWSMLGREAQIQRALDAAVKENQGMRGIVDSPLVGRISVDKSGLPLIGKVKDKLIDAGNPRPWETLFNAAKEFVEAKPETTSVEQGATKQAPYNLAKTFDQQTPTEHVAQYDFDYEGQKLRVALHIFPDGTARPYIGRAIGERDIDVEGAQKASVSPKALLEIKSHLQSEHPEVKQIDFTRWGSTGGEEGRTRTLKVQKQGGPADESALRSALDSVGANTNPVAAAILKSKYKDQFLKDLGAGAVPLETTGAYPQWRTTDGEIVTLRSAYGEQATYGPNIGGFIVERSPSKVSEQPIKEVSNEPTAPLSESTTSIVGEGAGQRELAREIAPAPPKPRPDRTERLVTGERSDISLSQFVRKRGGIAPGEMFAGELDRLRRKETGTTGLINQRNRSGREPMTAEYMMDAANEAGFRKADGQPFDNVGDFLLTVERDVAGQKTEALTGAEIDFEQEYRKHTERQIADEAERLNAQKSADALVSLLESGRGGELFDKITARNATPAEEAELRSLAHKRFIRTAELEDAIAGAQTEDIPISFEGQPEAAPSRGRAEQLGFVTEGLEQQALPPPKQIDQRERLIQEEKQRQRERNPERAAALDTLAMLREKGMTVDEYARQGSLLGETPTPERLQLLRELESGKFGPGAASAREPFPEVKERKFGKRFVEDERIAQEIRDSIGTAKYYEPIPNKVTAADAKKLVDERGVGQSINAIKDENNNIPFHVRVAMGEIVALRANKAYKNLKEVNPKEAELVLDQANETAEFLMDLGTRLGQGVQAYRMWSAQTPEGILLSYQKAVAKARQRHQAKVAGEEVREIVDTINKEMTHEERVEELKKLFSTNKTARKVRSQMDQLLKAAKDRKLEDKDFYDIVGDRLGLPKYDPKVASRIMDLAEQIADAPEGLPRDRKIFQLNKYLAEQKGFEVGDLPIGIYYGNILSGYNTHVVNSVDTALNVISEINGLAINNPRAAAKIYGGLLRGFSEGKLDAILTLTEGRMVTDGKWLEVPRLMEIAEFGKKGGVPISTATRRGRAVKSIVESKAGYPLNAYKYVTRMLAASDAVMFRSAKEARASLLAHRMAEAEGFTGDALDAKVRSILALDRRADFKKQAEREGFTGTAAKVRTAELIEMVRNKEVSSDAADFAGEATYNHKPHGALGYASEVIGNWAQKYKALKLFVPFTRIVANVTNRGLNWTPYGYKRAFVGYSHGEALTPENRRLMLTRATMGTVGLVTLGTMQEAGLLQIHGAGPSDREKKRQLQNAGWRPYSIQIGNTYISYVYSPTGLGLSIIGNMTDSQRYHELEQKDAATRAAYAVARLGSTVFSQSFLSGLSRLFNALSESPNESVTAVKQTMSSTVAAATTPNLARDVYRLFDNKAYQSNTLMEDLVRNTPFAALALKPQLNAFGEPVKVQRQRFFDVMTSDPAWKFVIEKGLKVPVPGRTLEIGKDERITPEQYYELLATTGPRIKQWVIANRSRLSKMTEDDAQDELSQAATRIRKFELTRMRSLARRKKAA